jgi:hypothetical protein
MLPTFLSAVTILEQYCVLSVTVTPGLWMPGGLRASWTLADLRISWELVLLKCHAYSDCLQSLSKKVKNW